MTQEQVCPFCNHEINGEPTVLVLIAGSDDPQPAHEKCWRGQEPLQSEEENQ